MLFDRVGDEGAIVPAHWPFEIANGALFGERRRAPAEPVLPRWIDEVARLAVDVEPASASAGTALPAMARAYRLTIYDAAYLELARRRGLPLASFDKALLHAARTVGVTLATDQA